MAASLKLLEFCYTTFREEEEEVARVCDSCCDSIRDEGRFSIVDTVAMVEPPAVTAADNSFEAACRTPSLFKRLSLDSALSLSFIQVSPLKKEWCPFFSLRLLTLHRIAVYVKQRSVSSTGGAYVELAEHLCARIVCRGLRMTCAMRVLKVFILPKLFY
ncbi:hypothetical protein BC829DRAFT_36045 [Chytridium lagenaria]|nr:hypothetical protein BC829DRAFT_36045 [Chytridium lagenaria]